MKKFILPICFIAVALLSTPSIAQPVDMADSVGLEIQDAVVLPFFEALKNGDVNEIKQYLSTRMYNEYKTLLEQNKEYPEFLRNYYRDATFSIASASKIDGEIEVDVIIEFPNNSQSVSKLIVSEETQRDAAIPGKQRWRINRRLFKGERDPIESAPATE